MGHRGMWNEKKNRAPTCKRAEEKAHDPNLQTHLHFRLPAAERGGGLGFPFDNLCCAPRSWTAFYTPEGGHTI
jgi:hypothetical protein